MSVRNYTFFNNTILRGIILKKYGIMSSFDVPTINRVSLSIDLKDKDDSISLENFMALNILTYITKTKSCCISHTMRYKFGQKHTFVFQNILRKTSKNLFLNFFCLNSLFLLRKKQIDVKIYKNPLHSNVLLYVKDLSFFSQLPAQYFKWDSGIKFEFSYLNSNSKDKVNISVMDLLCYFNQFLDTKNVNNLLNKSTFYYEIFNYKR